MAVEHSASKTILICCLASFSSRSLAVGNTGTMTVFRNTLDRATTGARGGATLVRANAASTAPARIYNFAKSVIYFLVAAKPSNSSTGLAFNDKKYNIPVLLPSCSAHFANFPPAQAGLGRLSNIPEIKKRNLGLRRVGAPCISVSTGSPDPRVPSVVLSQGTTPGR